MSEYSWVEKPFLDQLRSSGWEVVDQGEGFPVANPALTLRDSFRDVILPEVFRDSIRAINLTEDGRPWLTDRQLEELREQVLRQPTKNLREANEAVQSLFLKTQVDTNEVTGEPDPVVRLIDFEQPERNRFVAINQFRVDTPGCVKACIIPDIVLFVNGLPLVVVEAKIADANTADPMHEAFVQLLRYRNARPDTDAAGLREGEPALFLSNLLLVRTCGDRAEFGTISSGYQHFFAWKDVREEPGRPLSLPLGVRRAQEELVHGLLAPATLLHVLRTCTVFKDTPDGGRIKVVCRYQQYRAARRILDRLRKGATPEERSGVIWHTQGSGKSLTMAFVSRMIRASADLQDFKIIMVNDRVDLEEQLADTAKLIGGKVTVIASTAELRERLSTDASDVSLVMVHKFAERKDELPGTLARALSGKRLPSGRSFGVVNASDRILLMVDEAHRTQGSDLGENLFEAFPNATRIAFTGTPLVTEQHGEKRTVKRFGDYIDTYKLMDSVHDGTTLQILYEGRTADTALYDKHGFETKFEDLFRDRTEEELAAIRKKYGTTGDILEAEKRIAAIARDLVDHYVDNILPDGFKAQVVCHSKLAAVRYQKAIREALARRVASERAKSAPDPELVRRIEFLKAAVGISADATNEPASFTAARREAARWDAVKNFCRPFSFDDLDATLTGIAFLIVCDMLLTGFDAQVEQVMYIDKKLREHGLLQAIARVNRVAGPGKQKGYIVDYIGLANNLTDALSIYAREDRADLDAGLQDALSELPILEERYQRLLHFFRAAGIDRIEQFVTSALPDARTEIAVAQAAVSALKDLKLRADFDVSLKRFLQSLNLILPRSEGHRYRGPARRFGYLLAVAREWYKDESLDIADAGEKVKALINEHLVELGINPKIPPVELLAEDFVTQVARHSQGNVEARASEMEHAIRKHCTVHLDEDPAFYKRLSEKLEALIQKHKDDWEALAEAYEKLREEALEGRTQAIPGLGRGAGAFYDHVLDLAFAGREPPEAIQASLKKMVLRIVGVLRDTIDVVDFWQKPSEVRKLRGKIDNEIALAEVPELEEVHERVTVEIVKLAEKRHEDLVK